MRREDGDVLSDAIDEALRQLVLARKALDEREAGLVAQARSTGATWSDLGASLGLSKQAVRKRHLAVDPVTARQSQRPPSIAEYHEEMMRAIRAARGESVA